MKYYFVGLLLAVFAISVVKAISNYHANNLDFASMQFFMATLASGWATEILDRKNKKWD
jgi:NADH:ubiquinone oxidoreductase subunit 3 (subunit A)